MKKVITITVAAIMILSAIVLTACSSGSDETDYSDSKYVGTWKATTMSADNATGAVSDEWILTINADGTGKFTSGEEVYDFTWTPTNGGFKAKGDMRVTFKDDGDNIKVKTMGVEVTFEKQ